MNKTEYIGKLNALYVGDKNCLEELITIYDEKDKENRRLYIALRNREQEIERLNNIINEAIEYIKLWHYRNDFRVNSFTKGVKEELLEILDKGSEKEW